jgi:hypothetical protein
MVFVRGIMMACWFYYLFPFVAFVLCLYIYPAGVTALEDLEEHSFLVRCFWIGRSCKAADLALGCWWLLELMTVDYILIDSTDDGHGSLILTTQALSGTRLFCLSIGTTNLVH